ncbi:kinase D-interacting substrate of 220 kDa B-like [Branchiostoma lanceolatum]|uniref:kinase D-interacting substrate of 220 kDa B-like n=1 Tax=Branchiostoma lanceolatum TaxID=7740 RepID=UPI003452DE6B
MDAVTGSADSVFDEPDTTVSTTGTVELIARQDDHRGTLEVTVVRARLDKTAARKVQDKTRKRNRASHRPGGSCDPYVTVELGETILTTKVARQTYTPMFNDTFQFDLRNTTYDSVLHIRVQNFRTFRKDTPVGEVKLHVGELDLGKVQQYVLKAPVIATRETEGTDDENPHDTDPNINRAEETASLMSTTDGLGTGSRSILPGFKTLRVKDLHTAALVGDMGKVNKFLEAGHDVNEKKTIRLFPQNSADVVSEHEFQEVTPLHCAVVAGKAKIVSRLLRSGADALVRSKDLQSAMHMATWFGHGQILELLLLKYEVEYQQNMKQQGVTGPLSTTTDRLLNWVDPTMRKDLESMVWEASRVDNVAFLNVLVGQLQWTVEDLTIRDREGNTPLHIAVHQRYQSKKFAQALLEMNSDLLHVKNKAGLTVENVAGDDMKFTLMGAAKRVGSLKSDSHFEEDSLGYWVYAKTVADILTDESTTMPITVGIYARWGAGKSFILNQVKHEIDENIAKAQKLREIERYNSKITTKRLRSIPVPPFPFSSCASILAFLFFVATLVGGVLSYMYYRAIFKIVLIVGTISTICTCVIVGYLKRKDVKRILVTLFPGLHWTKRHLQLIGIWLDLLNPPDLETNPPNPGHVKVIHVQFNAWEYSGCSALWAGIVTKLCDEVETEIGPWTTRLYRAIHDKFMASERPPVTGRVWFKLLITAILGTVMIVLAVLFGIRGDTPVLIATSIVEVLCGVALGAGMLKNATKIWSFLRKMAISQRARLMAQTTKPNFDQELGFMAKVKTEVKVVTYLLRYFEAARRKQYRVVVVVDDLDRCPKDRVIKVIEAVGILLSDPNSYFISLLAVDPRIVVKSIEESFGDVMRNANINGYEYLKKIVQLPICLPDPGAEERKRFLWDTAKMSATERKVMAVQRQEAGQARAKQAAKAMVLNSKEKEALSKGLHKLSLLWRHDVAQETSYGSVRMRSTSGKTGLNMYTVGQSGDVITDKNLFLTEAIKSLQKDDVIRYVAGNPRHIRRLFNILCVSVGVLSQRDRLTRFTPKQVARWVLLVEQWPYRMSWIIQYVDDFFQRRELGRWETLQRGIQMHDKLVDIFLERVKGEISTQEEWSHLNPLDDDPEMFELFLTFAPFTVEDMEDLLPYTVNLDLSIRQTIGYARAQTEVKQHKLDQTSLLNEGESSDGLEEEADYLSGASSRQDRPQVSTPSRRSHQVSIHDNHPGPDSDLDVIVEEGPEEVCRNVQRQLSATTDDSTAKDATNNDKPAISNERVDERRENGMLGANNGHSTDDDKEDDPSTETETPSLSDGPAQPGEKEEHDSCADDRSPLLRQSPSLSNESFDDVSEDGEESPSVPFLASISTERESCI